MVDLIDETENFESLVGKTIGSYTITLDDVDLALRPAYAYVAQLLDTPGAEFYREQRVRFPAIANAFGTADLFVRIGSAVHVADTKFGGGVQVPVLTPDGDEDIINGQLLFYACGARHSLPEFFAGVETIVLTIVQPQSTDVDAEMVSSVEVTHDELDAFIKVYREACEEALSPAPRLQRGSWCRFCAARPICPAHTGPLLDLAQFAVPEPRDGAFAALFGVPPATEDYLQTLAAGLNLIDAVKDIGVALRDQAKFALEHGDCVPGYALSAGRNERDWRDDEPTAIAALTSLGLTRDDVVAEALRSPKQVEIRAKARGVKVPSEFIVSRRSGTSLVRAENAHAPVSARSEIVRSFAAAIEAFRQEQSNGQS
jgi:hypothetical protein